MAVEIALYTTLPSEIIVGPRVVVTTVCILLLLPLALLSRHGEPRRAQRPLLIALTLLVAIVNTISLVLLVIKIVDGGVLDGVQLLVAAFQVWMTNVISFALVFWELDRGGPLQRASLPRADLQPADFRFPQDEDHDAIDEVAAGSSDATDWRPDMIDYLYISMTNSSAFSPTDTMPLTSRVKILMAIESTEALILSLLVVAQAVSLIGA